MLVFIQLFLTIIKFAANKLLILSDIKEYSFPTNIPGLRITIPPFLKWLLIVIVVEKDLEDLVFQPVLDDFYLGYLLGFVEFIIANIFTTILIFWASLARLAVVKSKADSLKTIPPHFCDCEVLDLLQRSDFKRCHVWNSHSACHFSNCILDCLALNDRVDDLLLLKFWILL